MRVLDAVVAGEAYSPRPTRKILKDSVLKKHSIAEFLRRIASSGLTTAAPVYVRRASRPAHHWMYVSGGIVRCFNQL
jgi:hypothetical protein